MVINCLNISWIKKLNDLIAVYVSFDENKINGFIVLSVTENFITKKKQVFFNLAWISPKAGFYIGNQFIKIAQEYARSLGIDEVNAYSSRSGSALFKRFGFQEEFISYTIKVKGGKNELLQEKRRNESRRSQTESSVRPVGK